MKEKLEGTPIGNLLYTKEADDSVSRTKADLEVPDPKPEWAAGVLNGEDEEDEEKSN